MTVEELTDLFDDINDESPWPKFEDIENPRHPRPDMHAMLLLHELVPGTMDMVSAAEHDQIFFDVSLEALAPVITEEQVRELVACGVHTDEYGEGLSSFV